MENNEKNLEKAIDRNPSDTWTINRSKCTLCCECLDACLQGLLILVEKKYIDIKYSTLCTHCGDCSRACAYKAITLT